MRYVIVSVVKGPAGNFNNNLRKEVFEKIYRMCEKKGDTLTEEELDKALEEL